jgi:hypothetical protein
MSTPKFQPGDFVKVEFTDETTEESEWMWICVDSTDDEKRLVFGRLDNAPVLHHKGKLEVGSELAVSFDRIRDHKRRADFRDS